MYLKYLELLKSKEIKYREQLSLAAYSTFSIGGPAKVAVFPESSEELSFSITSARELGIKHVIIGNGSNLLFADEGFDGAVIFTTGCKRIEINGNIIFAECGASFTRLASFAARHSLTGLEFAYGIPGTVGGAVYMNAGAYGGQVSDVLLSSVCFNSKENTVKTLSASEHEFDYRTSIYDKQKSLTVLGANFKLEDGNGSEINAKMNELMTKRRDKQPLEFPNAGSTFKRPEGHFAGKLIEDSGLKGYTVGGAQVSEKHAGFVINRGGATARDVLELIEHIKVTVFRDFGVMLECEIKYIY